MEESFEQRFSAREWMMNCFMRLPDEKMIRKATNEERALKAAKTKMAKDGRDTPLTMKQKNWRRRGVPKKLVLYEDKTPEEIKKIKLDAEIKYYKARDLERKNERANEDAQTKLARRNQRNINDRCNRQLKYFREPDKKPQRNEKDRARRAQKKNNGRLS